MLPWVAVLIVGSMRPYSLSLAASITSFSSENGMEIVTGPKISSRTIDISGVVCVNTVGSM